MRRYTEHMVDADEAVERAERRASAYRQAALRLKAAIGGDNPNQAYREHLKATLAVRREEVEHHKYVRDLVVKELVSAERLHKHMGDCVRQMQSELNETKEALEHARDMLEATARIVDKNNDSIREARRQRDFWRTVAAAGADAVGRDVWAYPDLSYPTRNMNPYGMRSEA